MQRWRVQPASESGPGRIDIDTGRGYRPATIAEILVFSKP